MNVNINVNSNVDYRKSSLSKLSNTKEKFEKILGDNEVSSKKFLLSNVYKEYNGEQKLGKTINENQTDDIEKTNVKPSNAVTATEKSIDEISQMENLLESLDSLIQSVEKVTTNSTTNDKNKLDSSNLEKMVEEHLVGVGKLAPETKVILKNSLNEIVDLLDKSKVDNVTIPQILDVIQKLSNQVDAAKGNVSLLKVVSDKNKVTLDNSSDNNINDELKSKVINFVKVAIDVIKQNPEKPSEQLVGKDKSAENVVQVQQVLQSLSLIFQELAKVNTTTSTNNTNNDNDKNKLDSSNLEKMVKEHLVGVGKLAPETKAILKNSLNEIVALLDKSKVNNVTIPQILDVIQKLSTRVDAAKGNLNSLKVVSDKNTVVLHNSSDDNINNELKSKVINFVKVAIDVLKQNPEKPVEQLVGKDKSAENVVQVQQVLQSLSSVFQELAKVTTTTNNNNDDKNKLDSSNLEKMVEEHLVGVDKLAPNTKNILKNYLSDVATLIKKSKDNNNNSTQIVEVLQKLTNQVEGIKANRSLLKGDDKSNILPSTAAVEETTTINLKTSQEDNELKAKVINFVGVAIDAQKQNSDNSVDQLVGKNENTDKVSKVQQVIQSLSLVLQSVEKATTTTTNNELNSINLEQLVGVDKLTPEIKTLLKNNLTEIVDLIEKSKNNNLAPLKILDVLQKLTTEVKSVNGNFKLLKVINSQIFMKNSQENLIKDNLLTKVIKQGIKTTSVITPVNQMQNLGDAGQNNKSSDSNSFEEKFLNNLISKDKNETKISKVVNFMGQFEAAKDVEPTKAVISNITINKNNFEVDVIKNIKFMDINNVKDLIVKMNPKELGEVIIKITMESGIMKANISAQNKDTYNLLNVNIQDISDKLKNMEIKIHSLDINIYEDSTFFSKNSSGRNNDGRQNNNSKPSANVEEDIAITNNYVIEENQVNKFV